MIPRFDKTKILNYIPILSLNFVGQDAVLLHAYLNQILKGVG